MSRFMTLISSCVKYSMFFFNLLFVITGIIILIIGAVIQAEYQKYQPFLDSQYFSLPSFLIAIGALIFVIAFFGCCGAIKENYCMVLTFAILMVMIFIFELAAGISGFVLKGRTEALLRLNVKDTMEHYGTSHSITFLWDESQTNSECCGIDSPEDWLNINATQFKTPLSCCNTAGAIGEFICNATIAFQAGCIEKLDDWVGSHAGTLGAAGLVLALIQAMGIVFACHLARRTKYETMA